MPRQRRNRPNAPCPLHRSRKTQASPTTIDAGCGLGQTADHKGALVGEVALMGFVVEALADDLGPEDLAPPSRRRAVAVEQGEMAALHPVDGGFADEAEVVVAAPMTLMPISA